MRTLSAAASAAVMCLALGGMPALAQSPSPGAPVVVTGTASCTAREGTGTDVSSHGMGSRLGMVWDCVTAMSDPRLTGTATVTSNVQSPGADPAFFWGTRRIEGPDGGWDCSWVAMEPPPLHDSIFSYQVCRGTGGYDGLTFIEQHYRDGDILGYIFEGPPPVEIVPTDE